MENVYYVVIEYVYYYTIKKICKKIMIIKIYHIFYAYNSLMIRHSIFQALMHYEDFLFRLCQDI